MSDVTDRLALPLLRAGQAQKEQWHNEALALLDLACQPVVSGVGVDVPPRAPATGACWIVGDAPSGAWAGRAGAVAGWTEGGWRFLVPRNGWTAWSVADGLAARFAAGSWTLGEGRVRRLLVNGVPVVGGQMPAIADPAGGAVADMQARGAVVAMLAALRSHGLIAT